MKDITLNFMLLFKRMVSQVTALKGTVSHKHLSTSLWDGITFDERYCLFSNFEEKTGSRVERECYLIIAGRN